MATMKPYLVYTYNKTPDSDSAEYNDEVTMIKSHLKTMQRAIDCLDKTIKDNDNVPEWVQEKIAVSASMLDNVCAYMQSKETAKII